MLVDDSVSQHAALVEGMNKMGPDTPLISVKKAGKKLEAVVKDHIDKRQQPEGSSSSGSGSANVTALLKAIEDFNERIIPLFTQSLDQQAQIKLLLADQQTYVRQRDNLSKERDELRQKNTKLETDMQKSARQRSDALQLAEDAKKKLEEAYKSSTGWKQRAEDMEKEKNRLVDILERQKQTAQERLKVQKSEIASLKRKLEDAEREPAHDVSHGSHTLGHDQSRTQQSITVSSPPQPSLRHIENQPPDTLDFVGMPPPKFGSQWQISKPHNGGGFKKLRLNTETCLPLELDSKNRPTKAVALGPKQTVRVRR
ncbi:hypothetical protein JR316_0007766 [Psilocybe cubensis]|nr:hypothetical protein JR316_0007766 [Psilocybe cubensis]KAH9479180.1 hypothetical protein JR316_0007766 [Psilocybe cubensis]